MIEREAGERKSPRPLTPEVVEARIVLRVAELRVLAAWTSVLAARAQKVAPRSQVARPNFWPLACRCAAISGSPRKRT
jgi:hypothetical protein